MQFAPPHTFHSHLVGNLTPLTDNKTVRLPGAAPGWTSPRSGGGPERSGGRAAQPRAQRRSRAERPKGGPQGGSAKRESSVREYLSYTVPMRGMIFSTERVPARRSLVS